MRRFLAVAFLFLFGFYASPVNAQSITFYAGTSATSYMLDGQPAPTRAYSLRRLLTSYSTNKLINIVRASDSATTDIGFTSTGAFDTAAATTFCNATTCKVITWYDQSGNTANLTQGTDANRPSLVFNCLGVNPCVRFSSNTISIAAAGNITPATGLVSINVTANRSSGTGAFTLLRENAINNRMSSPASINTWQIVGGGGGLLTGVAADTAWHSATGIINGASSVLSIDGTQTSGTVTGNTTAGAPSIVGAASTTGDVLSAVVIDNVALSASAISMINSSQHAWWGF